MKTEEIYKAWKNQKTQIEIDKKFSGNVMCRLYNYKYEKRKSLFDGHRLIELISARPLGKAAVIAAGLLIGFVRITFVVYAFLSC